jgi:iron complex transport system substrate-binding protein
MRKNGSQFPAIKAGFLISMVLVLFVSACAPTAAPPPEPEAPAAEAAPAEPMEAEAESVEVSEPEPQPAEIEPSAAPTAVPEPEFSPVSFTDDLGRAVVIEEPPVRIVSLAPSITEMLFGIGAGGLVVGRTDYCDYPLEVLELPSIGGFSASSISIETIVALEPDLVIGGATRQGEVIEALDVAGIPAFALQRDTVGGTLETLQLLGFITDHSEEASTLVDEMQTRLDAVVDVVATIPDDERVTVFYEVWHEPLMTTTAQTFIGELIELAGGINVFGDLEESYPSISAETIIDNDPQVILGPSTHGDQLTDEMIAAREGWGDMTAVKSGAIFIIDGAPISHTGPRIVDALDLIAAALYPEYFGD